MPPPDLTVVVIVQDDPELLPVAVRSVTRQTLRNIEILIVDHASGDGTSDIADRLASTDERIRVIHLPDREGGPGRPCNTGFAEARGPFVTLCASDDELPRDACRRLLAAAELHDADLVLGRTMRIHPERDNLEHPWSHSLYDEEAAYDGIRARTGLLRDQISAAKLYSTDFVRRNGLLFPEDVIYEDQLFTLGCFVLARRIAVVPDVVYNWMIRTESAKPSITHTRSQIANLRDRISVNLRMDQFLRDHDAEDLAPVKDAKFIEHDLRLYLRELWQRSPRYQREFIDILADYVTTFPYAVAEALPTIYRVVLFMLRERDLEGTLAACEYVREAGRVSTELTRRDGRIYWGTRYLEDPAARPWLDVTGIGLDRTPISQQRIYNYLTAYTVAGSTVHITGVLRNQLAQIGPDDDLRLELMLRRRGNRATVTVPVDVVRWGPALIDYDTALAFGDLLPADSRPDDIWDLTLRTHAGGHLNATRTCVREAELHRPVPLTGRKLLAADRLEPYVTLRGNLSFRTASSRPAARLAGALRGRLAPVRAPLGRGVRSVTRRLRPVAYRTVLTRRPVDSSLVVFESFQGRQTSDNPRAVFDALRVARPDLTAVWSLSAAGRRNSDLPKGTKVVKRGSWAYFTTLARAGYWVDNFGMPRDVPKPAGTTYLQTWHGTPIKRLFLDTARVRAAGEEEKSMYQRLVDRWDVLIAPSPFFEHSMVRSANFGGTLLRTGAPRNDALVRGRDAGRDAGRAAGPDAGPDEATARRKDELDLPTDRRILLFAPTYRAPAATGDTYTPLDLELLADALGDQWYVLIRGHYYDRPEPLDAGLRWFARDVSTFPDLSALLLASDALLTDFSSVMFDYALLRRPMVFYAPDLDYYTTVDPLTYVDLAAVVPGPVVRTQDDVVQALGGIDQTHAEQAQRYEEFLARYCPLEDGHASNAVVEAVWGPATRSPTSPAAAKPGHPEAAQTMGGRPAMVMRATVRQLRGRLSP